MSNLRARVKSPEGDRDGGTTKDGSQMMKVKCPSLYQNGKKHIGSPAAASASTSLERYLPSRLRQALLYVIVIVQFIVITKQNATVASLKSATGSIEANVNVNDRTKSLLRRNPNSNVGPQQQAQALTFNQNPIYSYSDPIVHPIPITEKSLVSRVWHSNGSPHIHPDLQSGSCWCSGDDYCMCTPSLAIDTILTSGEEHVWLVKRKDVGKYATMGGFVEVGETTAEACARELKEEMNLDLNTFGNGSGSGSGSGSRTIVPVLEGIYADPMRDARRHTISAVYSIEIPEVDMEGVSLTPKAGDDAAEVLRIHYDEIEHMEFFADHKTILKDFIAKKKSKKKMMMKMKKKEAGKDETDSIKRDLCWQ
jgi:ADP-ribose pyrophosphatase YjhB (NUDIX family)